MTWLLVAGGAVVALGAGVAVGAHGPRSTVIGALVALTFAPFVADPVPGSAILGFRIVAGVLAAFLLSVAARRPGQEAGSPLGLPAALATAAAAFVAGLAATGVDLPRFGAGAALAAGLASVAVSVGPVVVARDALRLGAALLMLVNGAFLLRAGFLGTAPGLEAVLGGLALVALAAAIAVLVASAGSATGDLPIPGSAVERRRPTG